MATPMTFIIAALATYRLAKLISEEEGPFSVFLRLRGALDPDQQTWVGRGLNCIVCVSFWVALPIAVILSLFGGVDPYLSPLVWWGLGGAVVLIRRWEQKR